MPVTAATLHAVSVSDADPWERVAGLPCELSVEIPLARMKVGEILDLRLDSVLVSRWLSRQDVPLRANGVQLGFVEFEVIGETLAVRVTRVS